MPQPYQLLAGLLLAILIAGGAYLAGALSRSGMVAAVLLGTVVFGLGGLAWAVLLIAFFVSSSLLSHLFSRRKAKMEEKFSKGHQRDAAQVLANGGIAGLCVLLGQAFPGALWPWLAFAGALAAANADTWATELGVLSKSPPRSIRTGRVVEPGDSGGVSWMGILAATGGSLLIALLAVFPWHGMPSELGLAPHGLVILLITMAGLGGSLMDSLLGATVQVIYICPACGKETERYPLHRCGAQTAYLRGWRWMNNDAVNAFCTASGIIIVLAGGMLLPGLDSKGSGVELMNTIPLSSPAFAPGQPIPAKFTCEGENLSPELQWGNPPAWTKSLVLIMNDPDAPMGTYVHWVIYNIPSTLTGLPEGVSKDPTVEGIGTQGINSARKTGYTGPCPPPGKPHRYFFTLYALDIWTIFDAGFSKEQVLQQIEGHALAQGQLMGTYQR
jgi:Raf kinase inhibitor-like YbhB/YbcL family protein/uncharacterized protein (TIGR00297 family)